MRFGLVDEARDRGIDPVLLRDGDDLGALAADAVADGADVLGVAGGDGSQSVVAAAASAHDLPFVCVPAGTRNHFAVDLGVDADDVVGALDAYVDGDERPVDLGRVNGRVFVNNVSVGLYADIVATGGYRAHKVATAAQVLPDRVGPAAASGAVRYVDPDGAQQRSAQVVLVSNNPYRLTAGAGIGSRPALDGGALGIVAAQIATAREAAALVALHALRQAHRFGGWHVWTAPAFTIETRRPTEVGIDGEAVVLEPPLQFTIAPGALRVRIARRHSGVSPAAVATRQFGAHWPRRLADVARGRAPARA
jgi:diacylglycerol kinase family enzyme